MANENMNIIGAGQDTARPTPEEKNITCPACGGDLEYNDFFGNLFPNQSGCVDGEIYRCVNDCCDYFQEFFHFFYSDGKIRHGYPC